MSREPSFQLVPFHDAQILAAGDGDRVLVPMSRFCTSMGIDWPGQRRRILRDEILAEGVVMMTIPSDGGMQEALCLPLELIPGFLFGAETERFAPELRDRVKMFRREAFAALYKTFFGGSDTASRASASVQVARANATDVRMLVDLTKAIKGETLGTLREMLYGALVPVAARLGTSAAPLADFMAPISDDAARAEPIIERFWTAVATLDQDAGKPSLNHSRKPERVCAISLVEVEQRCANEGLALDGHSDLRWALRFSRLPRFVDVKTINSRREKPVYCWLFERDAAAQADLFPLEASGTA